jgi:hypothetical protein
MRSPSSGSRQFQGKRLIPLNATHHEIGHGRESTWAMRQQREPSYYFEPALGRDQVR